MWPSPGQVAITFDDGPVAPTTLQVLDVLANERVPATFFVNCARFKNAGMASVRASLDGHSIQNHTMNHAWLTDLSNKQIVDELAPCSSMISYFTHKPTTLFRPPYGSTSNRVEMIGAYLGMRSTMWNVAPSKMIFVTPTMVAGVSKQISRLATKGVGIVILLHDGSGSRAATVAALPELIGYLRSLKFEFVKLG